MQETDFYEQLLGLPDLRVDRVELTPWYGRHRTDGVLA